MMLKRILVGLAAFVLTTAAMAADVKISAEPAMSALGGTEIFLGNQGGVTGTATASQFGNFVATSGNIPGAVCDGSTDDSTALANVISAATATGGRVIIPAGKVCSYATSLTLANNVSIEGYGAKLTYTGSSYAFTTPPTGATNYASVRGLIINTTNVAAGWIRGGSCFHCLFRDLILTGAAGTTNIGILLDTNTTGTANPGGTLNTSNNKFDNVMINAQVGTAIEFVGTSSSNVVTNNVFSSFKSGSAGKVVLTGIYFSQWADSNSFEGETLIQLAGVSPANGVCLSLGADGPGIYSETFHHFACDTSPGSPATDNRQGILANGSTVTNITIEQFEYGPKVGLGAMPAGTTGQLVKSLIVLANNVTTNWLTAYLSGSLVLGNPTIPATPFWGQNGVLLSGPDYTATDSTSSGTVTAIAMSHLGQPTLAFSSATTVTNLANLLVETPLCGPNCTATNRYAIQTGAGGGIYSPASNSLFAGITNVGAFDLHGGIGKLNDNSNFDVQINTGNSTGATRIGNSLSSLVFNAGTVSGTGWANLPAITVTGATDTALSTAGIVTNTSAGALGTVPTVSVANGGTNLASYAIGDILYASAATTISKLADVAAGSYLLSGGVTTAPLWSTLTLPNAATTGDILYASGTNAIGRLADVATGQVLRSGGAAAAPAWGALVNSDLPATITPTTKFTKGITVICSASSASPTTHTGDQVETNLVNCSIPAGTLGTQGQLRISALWSRSATTTDSEGYKIRISTTQADTSGGALPLNTTNATSGVVNLNSMSYMYNTDATHQLYPGTASQNSPFATTTAAVTTGTIDTTNNTVYINFNCKNNTANGDTCGIYSYTVEMILP